MIRQPPRSTRTDKLFPDKTLFRSIPLIADADTGYGNALNEQRTARAFQRAGVAGFHLEDQQYPKRCGHYDDKSIVPVKEMAQKIHAVRDAVQDDDFVLIARTEDRKSVG